MTCLKLPNFSPTTREAANTVLDLTVKVLENSKDVISAAAPVPGLGTALDVLVKVLKKVQTVNTNRKALNSLAKVTEMLADDLRSLAQKVQDTVNKYPAASPERKQISEALAGSGALAERLNKLLSELNSVCDEAEKLHQRSFLGALVYSSRDAEAVNGLKDQIADAKQRFQMEEGVTTEMLVTQTSSEVKNVIAALKAAEEERVLSSIPRADDAHYLSAANAMKARLQEGTREQILAHMEEWEESQFGGIGASLPVFVLVGEAGTGKSTIASEFSRRLEKRRRLGASYFFTRGMQDLNSPRKLFSTIASQLARSQPALRGHIVDAVRDHATLQQLEREFEDLIRQPLGKLPEDHAPIFIVMDALDECTEEGPELVPELLRLLLSEAALRAGSPLRVFLTSRPEPHYIHQAFTASDVRPHISIISIQRYRDSVDHDIELFLRARLAEHETSERWSAQDPSIVRNMVERSDGLFIYARTAVEFILADVDLPLIQARYDALLRVEGGHHLAPLDRLYHTVLESVFPPEDRFLELEKRLKRVLEYLATLLEPSGISPRTLVKLTRMPMSDSVPILNKLRSVVLFERDNYDSPFRIIHATFREFLVDSSRSGVTFCVDAVEVHGRLADNCMSVMQSFLMEHWPAATGIPAVLLRLLQADLPKDLPELENLPHLLYAYTYRDHHLGHRYEAPDGPENCRAIGEDRTPPIPLIMSYVRNGDPEAMWDLIRTVGEQRRHIMLRESIPGDRLLSIVKVLRDLGLSDTDLKEAQIAAVTMLLDIRATGPGDQIVSPIGVATDTALGPYPLDTLYRAVLGSVLSSEDRTPAIQERFKRALEYLVTLQEPIGPSPTTLEQLTKIPMAESVLILNKLQSIIFVEPDNIDSPFRIIHPTFRAFLVDRSRSRDTFYVNVEAAHERLADDCKRTMRAFVAQQWPGSSGAAILLRLLTSPLPKLSSHVSYARTYLDQHLRPRCSVAPQDPEEGAGGDDTQFLTSIVSYVLSPSSRAMWDLICAVCTQSRASLLPDSKLGESLNMMDELLRRSSTLDSYGSGAQIAAVSLILDIQGSENHAVSEATPLLTGDATGSTTTLDSQSIQRLQHALKEALGADDLETALANAHKNFHKRSGSTVSHEDVLRRASALQL